MLFDHVIAIINPKTGERRSATLVLTEFQLAQAKRNRLNSDHLNLLLPTGFMPCDPSFASP